jgi:hypothetical protein
MSILVLQLIIKQWDKSQLTQQHADERANIANHYPINFPPARYTLDKQCVIDLHGDDLLKNRLGYSQPSNNIIQIDRFQVNLNKKELVYRNSLSDPDSEARAVGSLDERWIQCKYDWRYSVYEGGLYYWLYEEVTLNAIAINAFDENIFLDAKPERIMLNG